MRLILITCGVMTALALVLGFALADLNKIAKEHRDDEDRARDRRERALVVQVPQRTEAQVAVLRHTFEHFPDVEPERLAAFPRASVVKALVSLHGTSRDAEERLRYLRLLSTHGQDEGAAYLRRVADANAGPESAAARDLLSRQR